MEMKKAKIWFVVLVGLVLVTVIGSSLLLHYCQKEEEIPWWEDYDNLEYVLEDERSIEKSFTYRRPFSGRIYFNYHLEKGDTAESECIPSIRILHKGIEKNFYTIILKREKFPRMPNGIDWENPDQAVSINSIGAYRAYLKYSLKPDNGGLDDYVGESHIYIIIHKGE